MYHCRIPKRLQHEDAYFDHDPGDQAGDWAYEFELGQGLLLTGKSGSGKTYEAVKVLNTIMFNPDDKFSARFAVLCEYLMHHVKEEEGELFPQLKRAKLDWEGLCHEFMERREALLTEEGAHDTLTGMASILPTDETGLLMTGHEPVHYESGSITSRKI